MPIDGARTPPAAEHGPISVPHGYRVGRWEVEQLLGSGAWGSVYAARAVGDPAPGGVRTAALKFLPAELATPGRMAQLAEVVDRELAFAGGGRHEGLIATLEILVADGPGPDLDGARVIVMERARTSLSALLADHDDDGPLAEAAQLLAELWAALLGMHRRGWVHGDLKPSNVLVMDDGTVRLADFGLAAELDGTHAYAPPFGSLDYVPPEWWSERVTERGSIVRPGRDLWAYGVVAHQLLAGGRFPFEGQTPRARSLRAQAYARGNEPLRLDRSIPEPWRAIVTDLLEPVEQERARRSGSAGERIAQLCAGDGARRARFRLALRSVRRGRRRTAATLAAVATVAAGAAALLAPGGDAPRAFTGGELRSHAAVPARYRSMIVEAAHRCAAPALTPALIAAILKVESGFNPQARKPKTGEYGIAMWTPRVFGPWARDVDGDGANVFSAADSIAALADYLCGSELAVRKARGDPALVLAATYRVGTDAVKEAGGIPPQTRDYVRRVARWAERYATPQNH
jgi:eukaryotic-like serine/threonine-protein kinase